MKTALSLAAVALAAVAAFSAPAQAAHFTGLERYDFTIDLTSAAAGTPSAATGMGTFALGVDDTTGIAFADYSISIMGMTPTAMHFHLGSAGENGPVLYDIVANSTSSFNPSTGLTFAGSWNDGNGAGGQPTISQLVGMLGLETVGGDTGIYVNVHSSAFPGGEIRGQVTAPVPLPAALPLMAVGMAGLGLVARRRKNA